MNTNQPIDKGFLSAVGSSTNRIVFEGLVKSAPSWKGILFSYESDDVRNELRYCDVLDAGSDPTCGDPGMSELTANAVRRIAGRLDEGR